MSPSPTNNNHGVSKLSVSQGIHPLAVKPLIPDLEKVTEGKGNYKGVDEPYEADQESNGSHSAVTSANSTANSTEVSPDSISEVEDQYQPSHLQTHVSGMRTPSSILSEYMDESYFETDLYDADLNDTTNDFHGDADPGVSSDPADTNSVYDADKSSESSYDIHCISPSLSDELTSLRCNLNIPTPTGDFSRFNRSSQTTSDATAYRTFMVAHFKRLLENSPMVEDSSDSEPEPSIYESMMGCRRTSPTAQEQFEVATTEPSGVTWTVSEGPFDQNAEAFTPSPPRLDEPAGHAATIELADRITRVSYTKSLSSSTPRPPTGNAPLKSKADANVVPCVLPDNFSFIPVLPRSENLWPAVETMEDDWDCSEIRSVDGQDVLVKMRYALGGKGFLRLN
ncbi:MAG: hypothetical protein L6R40_000479 [Gallowayella cf. fulva]|nr:MAG: hypothetical protein L6R40_000479 [Xanthomendoza cf. fulva]